ncbi:hypothetical protein P3L10_005268 [Capsicum annuum]
MTKILNKMWSHYKSTTNFPINMSVHFANSFNPFISFLLDSQKRTPIFFSMAEEFQESDVLFGQNNDEVVQKSADENSNDEVDEQLVDEEEPKECGFQIRRNNINLPTIREVTMKPNSSSILVNASWLKYVDNVNDDDEDELVPPHVLIRRRIIAFSVCVGYTLKGGGGGVFISIKECSS